MNEIFLCDEDILQSKKRIPLTEKERLNILKKLLQEWTIEQISNKCDIPVMVLKEWLLENRK